MTKFILSFFYYIGKVMNIDVSKPKYSDDSMKLYFYKGDL